MEKNDINIHKYSFTILYEDGIAVQIYFVISFTLKNIF